MKTIIFAFFISLISLTANANVCIVWWDEERGKPVAEVVETDVPQQTDENPNEPVTEVVVDDDSASQDVGSISTPVAIEQNNSSVTAINMSYHVIKDRQKFINLSAYSDKITYLATRYLGNKDVGVRYLDAISSWKLISPPSNGIIYSDNIEVSANSEINPNEIVYIPFKGFTGNDSFVFEADGSIGTITLNVQDGYNLPEEITAPFSVAMQQPPSEYKQGDWYIDNSHPLATDSPQEGEGAVRKGTPNIPRATLPPSGSIFDPGTVVFIKGGVDEPYFLRNSSWHRWVLNGTEENPVFIVGEIDNVNKPVITNNRNTQLRLEMNYSGIYGVHFKRIIPQQRNQLGDYDKGNIIIAHSVIDNEHSVRTGSAVSLNIGPNKMFYDVHIKNAGWTEPDLSRENDVNGIQLGNVDGYWVIDSVLRNNAGDSIQINGENARNIYIVRNKFHSDNENAVDFKRRAKLFFIENDVWDYRSIRYRSSGSDGTPVIVNQDTRGQTPENVLITRNRIWDANGGVRHQGTNIRTTHNLFWKIKHNQNSDTRSYAITVGNNGTDTYIEEISNNIFSDVDGGVFVWAANNRGEKKHIYSNNVFESINSNSLEGLAFSINNFHAPETQIYGNKYKFEPMFKWRGDVVTLQELQSLGQGLTDEVIH